jgi:hypothetical protein
LIVSRAERAEWAQLHSLAPNMLLLELLEENAGSPETIGGDAAICRFGSDASVVASRLAAAKFPIVAYRPLPQVGDVATARLHCDLLQAELAPSGDFAGYVV